MTPERKKYLARISDEERAVRFYIKSIKHVITVDKRLLATGETYSLVTGEFSVTAKADLAISKKILSMLKKQLPQRWPEKKPKPCPFCGYKAVYTVHSFVYHKHCGEYVTYCPKCQCRTNSYISCKPSVEAWNRRV